MRAAWFESQGPAAEVLEVGEMETPEPGPGEVRVRVHASGVNPSDVKKRAGLQPAALDEGPVIPHSDGAGFIDALGEGVPGARLGERVWVYQAQYQRRLGTAAEYVTLPAARAVRLPDSASIDVGACLGIPAMTAHRCVLADGPVAGQDILVTGAAGRVGYYAVQWAKWMDARVIATVGNDASANYAREAGADVVVNYRTDDVAEAVKDFTEGEGVHRMVDVEFGKNIETTANVIRQNGVVASYSSSQVPEPTIPFYPLMFNNVTLRLVLVYAMPESAKRQAEDDIIDFLEHARLTHRVAETHSLGEIARAHEAIDRGGVPGCVVVTTD